MFVDLVIDVWTKISSLSSKLPWQADTACSQPRAIAMATCGLVTGWYLWRRYQYRNIPPGPWSVPLIGSVGAVSDEHMDSDLHYLGKKYGDVYSVWLGSTLIVVLASHSAMKEALVKQGDVFANRTPGMNRALNEYMGFRDDIFASPSDGKNWLENKAFLVSTLRGAGFGSTDCENKVLDQVDRLLTQLNCLADKADAVDLLPTLQKAAVNAIFHILCNKIWEYDDPQLADIAESGTLWMDAFGEAMVLEHVPKWMAKIFYRNKIRCILEDTSKLKKIIHDEVISHKKTLDPNNPRDFIDLYLSQKGGVHDITRIVDNTMIFTPDAIDLIPSLLYTIVLYLCYHQNVQQKIVEEIENITNGNRKVTWADHTNLPFTMATIMEVMRLATPFPIFAGHAASRDVSLKGFRVPKNTSVYLSFYSALRDPDIYPDPDNFRPDRYIDETGQLITTDSWIPFGMGKRRSPGEKIAKMELFVFISNIMQQYRVTLPAGEQPTLTLSGGTAMVRKPQPYRLILTNRQ